LESQGPPARFSHHGTNEGDTCFIIASIYLKQGAVVMTNLINGFNLIQEIIQFIPKDFGWVD
jgi:hypothetical protein